MRTAKQELYRQALVNLITQLGNTVDEMKLIAGSLVTAAGRLQTAAGSLEKVVGTTLILLEDEG